MKKTKLIVYYVIVLGLILCGFFVGSKEKTENHGYRYYYGEDRGNVGNWQLGRASEEIGDFTKTKIVSWYIIPLKTSHKYFAGNLELDYEFIKKAMPISEIKQLRKDDFNYIHYVNLIWFLIICIILFGFPFGLSFIVKCNKKNIGKKKIKNLKELADMKELGIISEEEFETKKKQLLEL